MATVTLSNGLLSRFYTRLSTSGSYDYNLNHYNNTDYYTGRICLMSGTIPTDFTDLTTRGSLSDQVLWAYDNTGSFSNNSWETEQTGSAHTSSIFDMKNYAAATATGTAEWFWYSVGTSISSSSAIYFQFIGTVGTSGTDLVLPTTSITSGKNYRIRGLRLQIAQDYTY